MKEKITLGDYVYIPSYSRKALKVVESLAKNRPFRAFINDDTFIDFQENGLSSKYYIEPIAFLANSENKANIERFYGCELELPVVKVMAVLSIPHDNC